MRPWVGCGRRSLQLVFLCPVPPGAHREAPAHSVTAHVRVSKSHLSNWAKTRTHACTYTLTHTHVLCRGCHDQRKDEWKNMPPR